MFSLCLSLWSFSWSCFPPGQPSLTLSGRVHHSPLIPILYHDLISNTLEITGFRSYLRTPHTNICCNDLQKISPSSLYPNHKPIIINLHIYLHQMLARGSIVPFDHLSAILPKGPYHKFLLFCIAHYCFHICHHLKWKYTEDVSEKADKCKMLGKAHMSGQVYSERQTHQGPKFVHACIPIYCAYYFSYAWKNPNRILKCWFWKVPLDMSWYLLNTVVSEPMATVRIGYTEGRFCT